MQHRRQVYEAFSHSVQCSSAGMQLPRLRSALHILAFTTEPKGINIDNRKLSSLLICYANLPCWVETAYSVGFDGVRIYA